MRLALTLALAVCVAVPHVVRADCSSSADHSRNLYVLPGGTFGYAADDKNHSGVLVGGEVSVAVTDEKEGGCGLGSVTWLGGYTDIVYSTSDSSVRWTIGPELGMNLLGVDGGFALRSTSSGVTPGLAIRPVLSLGVVQLYVRWEHFDRWNTEAGILVKWPLIHSTKQLP